VDLKDGLQGFRSSLSEDLEILNDNIVGLIEIIGEYH
jgi:hypothetical protein